MWAPCHKYEINRWQLTRTCLDLGHPLQKSRFKWNVITKHTRVPVRSCNGQAHRPLAAVCMLITRVRTSHDTSVSRRSSANRIVGWRHCPPRGPFHLSIPRNRWCLRPRRRPSTRPLHRPPLRPSAIWEWCKAAERRKGDTKARRAMQHLIYFWNIRIQHL
jgi:hypothetical protein